MRLSLRIARLAGTDIRLHWTMLLILPYVYVAFRPATPGEAARGLLLVGLVFLSVLLHELGHLIVARLYKLRVSSVVLWALGGAAVTESEPDDPGAQFFIAVSGPIVNLLVAALVLIGLVLAGLTSLLTAGGLDNLQVMDLFAGGGLLRGLTFIVVTNLILAFSNLLPIYPLDGGRIFHALVHMLAGPVRSAQVTFWLSILLALALFAWAVSIGSWAILATALLLLIGSLTLNQPLYLNLLRGLARLLRRPDLFIRLSDYDPAVELLTAQIDRRPNNPDLYLQRGYAHYFLEDLLQARADVDRALSIHPAYLPAILLKGAVAYALGVEEEAWKMVELAEDLRPEWSINDLNRAVLLHLQGRNAEALDCANRAVERSRHERGPLTSPVLAHLVRSLLLFEAGDLTGARADWEQARRLNPREAVALTPDRARIFAASWGWVEAYYAWLEQHGADRSLLLLSRADVAMRAGQYARAAADYDEALRRLPALNDLVYYRGLARQELARQGQGTLAAAADDFRAVQRAGSRPHIRRLAAAQLKSIESQPTHT